MIYLARWGWLIILFLLSFTTFYASGIDTGVSHDKLKYLGIAWSMYQDGYHLLPTVNGIPYSDKPPLLFWLIASAWHLLGVNMFALQCLIHAIIACWALLLRACYAVIFPYDSKGKTLIPYILLGSYAVWRDLWFLRVDLLLVTGVLLCNLGILQLLSKQTHRVALFFIAIGCCLGLFAKGPVIYVFTLLPYLISSLWMKCYRQAAWRILLAFIMGSVLFISLWALPVVLQAGDAFAQQIGYQQIAHRASYHRSTYLIYFYHYLPILLAPWIINLLFFKKIKQVYLQMTQHGFFLITLFSVVLIIFSLFGQKSLWYILPIVPFLLMFITRLLTTYAMDSLIIRTNRGIFAFLFAAACVFCLLLGFSSAAQSLVFKGFGGHFALSPWVMLSMATIAALSTLYLLFSKRDFLVLMAISSMLILSLHCLVNTYFFNFEKAFTHIDEVGHLLQQVPNNVALYQTEYLGQFAFASRRSDPIPSFKTPKDLSAWLDQHPKGIIIITGNACPSIGSWGKIAQHQERVGHGALAICQFSSGSENAPAG